MLLLIPGLLDSLGANGPRLIVKNLEIYASELSTYRARASWNGLERLMRNAESAFSRADQREFEHGAREQFADILRLHGECRMALPKADERFNRLVDTEVDEAASGPAISEPTDEIEAAAKTLKENGLTDASFDHGIADIVRIGRDEAFPPAPRPLPEIVPDDPNALETVVPPAVSSRKAWIIGALGIAKETYHLLSSTVTLAGRDGAKDAMEHLAKAIAKLMDLLR
jgi:hypothetical protein